MTLRSPDEMMAAAKVMCLDGRDPESQKDWQTVMNFFAANVQAEVAEQACLLMRTIFEMPLSDLDVIGIVQFQLRERAEAS
jgi:hypothetical protein